MSYRLIDSNELVGKVDFEIQDIINNMDCVYVDGIELSNQHFNLEEHDKQIKVEVIDEVKEAINEHLFDSPLMNPIMTRNEILLFLEQLKEKKE